MFQTAALLDSQKETLRRAKKRPKEETRLSGRDNEISLKTSIFIENMRALSEQEMRSRYPGRSYHTISSDDYLPHLLSNKSGIVTNAEGQPFLKDVEELDRSNVRQRYLEDRDVYRQEALAKMSQEQEQEDYWASSSTAIAGKIFQRVKHTATRPFITRMVYDKHVTGRNMWKQSGAQEDAECKLCTGQVEDQRHILCYCPHPLIRDTRKHHWDKIEKEIAEDDP